MNAAKRLEILTRFRAANPSPKTELEYTTPFELLIAVLLSAQALRAEIVARARVIGLCLAPGIPARGVAADGIHDDAVDGAGRHAQVAARAQASHHRMHLLGGADDGVDGAGLDAQGTADTQRFVDVGDRSRPFEAVDGIERDDFFAQQVGQAHDALRTARRALVDVGAAGGNCFRIRAAAVVAALGALRLRQQVFDLVGK